jgi:hypothetical protein
MIFLRNCCLKIKIIFCWRALTMMSYRIGSENQNPDERAHAHAPRSMHRRSCHRPLSMISMDNALKNFDEPDDVRLHVCRTRTSVCIYCVPWPLRARLFRSDSFLRLSLINWLLHRCVREIFSAVHRVFHVGRLNHMRMSELHHPCMHMHVWTSLSFFSPTGSLEMSKLTGFAGRSKTRHSM